MREVIALLGVAFHLLASVALVTFVERRDWFVAALSVILLAPAFRKLAMSTHLIRTRQWLGLSFERGYQLFCLAYVVAGVLAMIGALVSLDRAFGLIVAFGAFCWVWGWGWILAQFRPLRESGPPAPSDGNDCARRAESP